MSEIGEIRRPFLSYLDLDDSELADLLATAADVAVNGDSYKGALSGVGVGLLFTKPSTRTRTSFWRAATHLGADVISFGPGELQLSTGESWTDTGDVLAQYLDVAIVRTNGPISDMRSLSCGLPATINAMSSSEHPTQALSDFVTISEHFGSLDRCRLAYFGEGNNTASALALLLSRMRGTKSDFYCPPDYGLDPAVVAAAFSQAERSGAVFLTHDEIPDNPEPADVVYTTRWLTMGVHHERPDWVQSFKPFQVDERLFEKFSGGDHTVLMHDLPAVRGQEVSEILDGPRSIVLRQAHHKQTGAAAALLWALGIRR